MIAYYPSPAGCTESLLDFEAWNDIVQNNPRLDRLQPDVEALLVNRTRGRRDYFIAPIDQCYKLTGLIRRRWRGFSGGDEVWQEIERFFERFPRRRRTTWRRRMPDLHFAVEGAEAVPYSATPLLALKLRIRNTDSSEHITSILLQSQIQIEATRRHYTPPEQERLLDLFGEPERWGQTLRNTLWTHATVNVPTFQGETCADLPRALHVRFQCRRHEVFPRARRWSRAVVPALQRHGFL